MAGKTRRRETTEVPSATLSAPRRTPRVSFQLHLLVQKDDSPKELRRLAKSKHSSPFIICQQQMGFCKVSTPGQQREPEETARREHNCAESTKGDYPKPCPRALALSFLSRYLYGWLLRAFSCSQHHLSKACPAPTLPAPCLTFSSASSTRTEAPRGQRLQSVHTEPPEQLSLDHSGCTQGKPSVRLGTRAVVPLASPQHGRPRELKSQQRDHRRFTKDTELRQE
uniref:uncharacterized protein LOC118530089 n=1 Tax=Halichoerus grypus TaxID=9711 RepID=UPI00165997AC|nr:uncharacterized protein LOC118530089 [Halichoerus grypus]